MIRKGQICIEPPSQERWSNGRTYIISQRTSSMVPERESSNSHGTFSNNISQAGFWMSILSGAAITVIIGILPLIQLLAPVVGGAFAGYLHHNKLINGVMVGALAGVTGGIALNLLIPPRFFGFLGGDIGEEFYILIIFGFITWTATSAFGGAIGVKLAERRIRRY